MSGTDPERTYPAYGLCGVPLAALGPEQAAQLIVDAARHRLVREVHLCNAYTLSLVDRDARMREALLRPASLNLADGTPVAWAGRKHGVQAPVRGPSLMLDILRMSRLNDLRHYFYGGYPDSAQDMARNLGERCGDFAIAGQESPPFTATGHTELRKLADRVRASDANVLWIGLGTPKQDYTVAILGDHLDIPVVAVGAAFDFWAGRVRQAPQWLHGSGLEWTHRLSQDPKRLWRRYLYGNPRFVLSALRHRTGPRTLSKASIKHRVDGH